VATPRCVLTPPGTADPGYSAATASVAARSPPLPLPPLPPLQLLLLLPVRGGGRVDADSRRRVVTTDRLPITASSVRSQPPAWKHARAPANSSAAFVCVQPALVVLLVRLAHREH